MNKFTLLASNLLTFALSAKPNFLFIITDDQDIELNSLSVMPSVTQQLVEAGMTFDRAYVDSPKCCPSRTSLFSGRLSQNLQAPSLGWCGNFTAQRDNTWTTSLGQQGGYVIGQFGKWYNEEQTFCKPASPFVPAWKQGRDMRANLSDFYVMCEEVKYYGLTYNHNGVLIASGHSPSDYLTSYLGNRSLEWLDNVTDPSINTESLPWIGYIAHHAPHLPAEPAPWYTEAPLPSSTAPRTPNFNTGYADKHWLVNNGLPLLNPLNEDRVSGVDALYRSRLRALMSVDDAVAAYMALLQQKGVLNNTYIVYTSDHGYHLGQWALGMEKSQPYETDARVPLFIRGPGIPAGSHQEALVLNVDLPPTLLQLAGIPDAWPDNSGPRDGRSLVPLLTQPHTGPAPPVGWRDRIVVQYVGWNSLQWLAFCSFNLTGLPCSSNSSQWPAVLIDAPSVTYTSLRVRNASVDTLYAEFRPQFSPLQHSSTNWTEAYDLTKDPWQISNLAVDSRLPASTLAAMQAELWALATCVGPPCAQL